MDVSKISNVTVVAAGVVGALVIYHIITSLALWRKREALKREKGVLEAFAPQKWWDLLGIDLFLMNIKALKEHRILRMSTDRLQHHGVNTVQVRVLGRLVHQTIEPENLKTIQAVDFKKWGLGTRRKTNFRPLLGDGIFTTDGAAWQHSRDMLRPNFVRSQVGDLATFETHVSHLIAAIPRDGSTVDLSPLFFSLTIDSATEFLFGESIGSLEAGNESNAHFAEAFTYSQEFIANDARWGMWAKLMPANKRFKQDSKFVHDLVDSYVQKGLARKHQLLAEKKNNAQKSERYVFIDELVCQTPDPIRIRSELLHILLAGRDTTASLLSNVWFTLSKRPDIWTKLQAEVARLDGNLPTFEQLKELKYLRAILNESLRLYPVVPVNSREALEDTTLPVGGGPDGRAPILIKKGNVMTWNLFAMHRRQDFYGADAEEFRPERWLDDAASGVKGLRPGWEYLPFNGGARICLGQQFALTEASYTCVRLCQAFAGIESRDPEPWKEGLTLTCVSLNGAKVGLSPRK